MFTRQHDTPSTKSGTKTHATTSRVVKRLHRARSVAFLAITGAVLASLVPAAPAGAAQVPLSYGAGTFNTFLARVDSWQPSGDISADNDPVQSYELEFDPLIVPVERDLVTQTLRELLRSAGSPRLASLHIIVARDASFMKDALIRRAAENSAYVDAAELAKALTSIDYFADSGLSYGVRGPFQPHVDPLPHQTILVLDKHAPSAEALAQLMAVETGTALVRSNATGTRYSPFPCWAAEGIGWGIGTAALARTTRHAGTSPFDVTAWRNDRLAQLGQLFADDIEVVRGMGASESFGRTKTNPCLLLPGVGHLQGMMFIEGLVARDGVQSLLDWSSGSFGRDWRTVFEEVYSLSIESAYAAFLQGAVPELLALAAEHAPLPEPTPTPVPERAPAPAPSAEPTPTPELTPPPAPEPTPEQIPVPVLPDAPRPTVAPAPTAPPTASWRRYSTADIARLAGLRTAPVGSKIRIVKTSPSCKTTKSVVKVRRGARCLVELKTGSSRRVLKLRLMLRN
jgi:hypothetical protein